MRRNVTILGGGNGARAAAAELSLLGHGITLYEARAFRDQLNEVAAASEITAVGEIEGVARLRVEADLEEAVADADLILIVVPTNVQRYFAERLAPLLADGMNVALMPGSLGSLEFAEVLRGLGVAADITITEFAALPYATRIETPTRVRVFGRRKIVAAGVFPADATDRVAPILADLYPGIEILRDVLEAGLNNPNPTLHCLGVLLSASRIEYSRGEFYYYEEGLTPHVCQAVEAIDEERLSIGRALDLDILSLKDTYWKMGYGPKGDSFWSVIRGVAALQGIKGPMTVDSRYLTEDVPIGLTIYSQLGAQIDVGTSIMGSVITLAGALLGRDFRAEGRTVQRCGIAGMSAARLREYVTNGR
ncbi:MAG: NAD/NADP octopine/nopaline dehydrogenase family protein [Actinobacteria bacterium]|nr:NAD/NADP octopine/nopaline dehydrogenase family protein [Actinomycetota bacterium]